MAGKQYNRSKRNRGRDSNSPRRGDSPGGGRQSGGGGGGGRQSSRQGDGHNAYGDDDFNRQRSSYRESARERRESNRDGGGRQQQGGGGGRGGGSAQKFNRQGSGRGGGGGGGGGSSRRSLERHDSRRGDSPLRRHDTSGHQGGSRSAMMHRQGTGGSRGGGAGSAIKRRSSGRYDSRSPSRGRRSDTDDDRSGSDGDGGGGGGDSDDESSSSERDEAMMYPTIQPNSTLVGQQYRVVRELGKGICARVVHAVEGAHMEPNKVKGTTGIFKAFMGQRDVALKVFRATSTYQRAAFEEYSFLVDLMTKGTSAVTQQPDGQGGHERSSTVYCDLSVAEEKHFLAPYRFHFAPPPQPGDNNNNSSNLRGRHNKHRRKRENQAARRKEEREGGNNTSVPNGTTSAIITFPLCGPSLFSMLEQRKMVGFPLHAVRNILFQLFTCLAHCEEKGVMHGDVKPENILLTCRTKKLVRLDRTLVTTPPTTSAGTAGAGGAASSVPMIEEPQHWGIVLSDFGNAFHPEKTAGGQQQNSPANKENIIQTRQYRAPEIILKCGYTSPATDIWSVGCMIPELLTGQCLWLARDHMEQLALMEQVLSPISENTLKYFFANSLQFPGKFSYGVADIAQSGASTSEKIKVPLCEAHRYFLEDPSRKRGYQLRWPEKETKTKDLTYVNGADTIETIVNRVVLGGAGHGNAVGGGGDRYPNNQHNGGGKSSPPFVAKSEPSAQAKETAKNLQDLIFRCLTYNPTKRITPSEALKHPFFIETSF